MCDLAVELELSEIYWTLAALLLELALQKVMKMSHAVWYTNIVINYIGVLMNFLLLASIVRKKQLRTVNNFFILVIALSDLSSNISYIIAAFTKNSYSRCQLNGFLAQFLSSTAVLAILSLSLYHYRSIVLEKYETGFRGFAVALLLILSLSGLFAFLPLLNPDPHDRYVLKPSGIYCAIDLTTHNPLNISTAIFNVVMLLFTPFIVVFAYYFLWKALNTRLMHLEFEKRNVQSLIVYRAAFVSTSFLTLWSFMAFVMLYGLITKSNVPYFVDTMAAILCECSTVANPCIYFGVHKAFKDSLKEMLGFEPEQSTPTETCETTRKRHSSLK
jgi:hypothetical protein